MVLGIRCYKNVGYKNIVKWVKEKATVEGEGKMSGRREEFAVRLMEFYNKFLGGIADSIEYLADIQEEFPEEYENFKNAQIDLNKMPELLDELDPEMKGIFADIIIRIGIVSSRLNNAIILDSKEKIELAKELRKIIKAMNELTERRRKKE